MADTFLRSVSNVQSPPADLTVPNAAVWVMQTATAVFDGTAAVAGFFPALQIIGPGGIVQATFVDWSNTVPAGDSVEVTFGTFLGAVATPCPPCNPYDGILAKVGATAWWPLTEKAGSVAHDQSGNGHDLTATGSSAPIWEQWLSPVAVPGPLMPEIANFGNGGLLNYKPNLSGDFAYNVWVQQQGELGTVEANLGNQGNPFALIGGWALRNRGNLDAPDRFAEVYIGATGVLNGIFSDAALPVDTPYLMGVRLKAGTWTMWVNGVQQAATFAGPYTWINTYLQICEGRQNGAFYSYASLIVGTVSDTTMQLLYTLA